MSAQRKLFVQYKHARRMSVPETKKLCLDLFGYYPAKQVERVELLDNFRDEEMRTDDTPVIIAPTSKNYSFIPQKKAINAIIATDNAPNPLFIDKIEYTNNKIKKSPFVVTRNIFYFWRVTQKTVYLFMFACNLLYKYLHYNNNAALIIITTIYGLPTNIIIKILFSFPTIKILP